MYYLKSGLDIFAQRMKNKGAGGIYLNEMWVRGDSIEYEGRLKQQIRWAEGSTNALLMWGSHIIRSALSGRGWGKLNARQMLIGSHFNAVYLELSIMGIVSMLLVPVTVLITGQSPQLDIPSLAALCLSLPSAFYMLYLSPYLGVSKREAFHFIALQFYGTVFNIARGVTRAFIKAPAQWFSNKKGNTAFLVKNNIAMVGLVLLNTIAAAKVYFDSPGGDALNIPLYGFVNAVLLLYTFTLQEPPPEGHKERAQAMYRQFEKELTMAKVDLSHDYKVQTRIPYWDSLYKISMGSTALALGTALAGLFMGGNIVTNLFLSGLVVSSVLTYFALHSQKRALTAVGFTQKSPVSDQKADISEQPGDGGKKVAGIDLRSLPAVIRSDRADRVSAQPGPAENVPSIRELRSLKRQIIGQLNDDAPLPYDMLTRYYKLCRRLPHSQTYIAQLQTYVLCVLQQEQDAAIETPQEFKEFLTLFCSTDTP
jgi:hypothetical protein